MSRIGLSPIEIPNNVNVSLDGNVATFSCNGCSKIYQFPTVDIAFEKRNNFLHLVPLVELNDVKKFLGLHRSIVKNIVVGLSEGFKKELSITGVGYKAAVAKKYLIVSIGYSHDIYYKIPDGVSIEVIKDIISIKSNDKILIGAVSVDICKFRKFDPYKGKGIYVKGSFMLRKQAKKK